MLFEPAAHRSETVRLDGERLARLPGVRGQIERMEADLAAGRNCVWLMPDEFVADGIAEELHRTVLSRWPEHVHLPEPATTAETHPLVPETGWPGAVAGDVPVLDDFEDGFDIGWDGSPAPSATFSAPSGGPSELMTRLAKELSTVPEAVVDQLTAPDGHWHPVIGVRAWTEPDPRQAPGGRVTERGHGIARLIRALGAAIKESGLAPDRRPRVLVTGRLRDFPSWFPDELELELGTTGVHWWWGTIGRLDSATLLAGLGEERGGPRSTGAGGAVLRARVLRAVREEVVSELCGPDISLAVRLFACWDGSDRTLDDSLRACLSVQRKEPPSDLPTVSSGAGIQHKPPSTLRKAWARGVLQTWEGRARLHPVVWHTDGGAGRPDRLSVLVSQAQARVLMPWVEETRRRLAEMALSHAKRPPRELVELYVRRKLPDHATRPERTFVSAEAGDLQRACLQGHIGLPQEERLLLSSLVKVRNVLSHRGVLRDTELADLCDKLAAADLRWTAEG
ncbi:hypothetical protein [Streptomyces tendae]|uniref:hypothetical protein n=1 Tax=Streptomyces tendae TaxID=1932 RepID=UPI002491C672|nr:hypothetical protein [Streptomyces tendae]